jgi:heat shock protein HslJ
MADTRVIGRRTLVGRTLAGSSAWLRVAVVGVLLLGACANAESTTGMHTDGTWILTEATVDDTALVLADEGTVTLNVRDDALFGQAACNNYGADYDVDGYRLTIEFGGMTAVGCAEAVQALEDAYLGALERVDSFERASDDQLVLAGDGVELVFVVEAPVDLAGMVGPTWTLVELRDGDTTIDPGGDGFVRFDEGTMTGSTGCRDLGGTWTAQGSSIAFSNLGADGECPARLREQDRFVTGIFENMTATVTGEELVLSSRQGGRSLVFARE